MDALKTSYKHACLSYGNENLDDEYIRQNEKYFILSNYTKKITFGKKSFYNTCNYNKYKINNIIVPNSVKYVHNNFALLYLNYEVTNNLKKILKM